MIAVTQGERVRGFIVFTDQDGLRHAVRMNAVLAMCDGDDARDTTVCLLSGGRTVCVMAQMDEVLTWFP